jgi:hypothetical protein
MEKVTSKIKLISYDFFRDYKCEIIGDAKDILC